MIGWVPVCLALGIGAYFSLRTEPGTLHYLVVILGGGILLSGTRICRESVRPFVTGLALVLVGFLLAGARAHHVGGPVLEWRYYGAVDGRIVAIDRSQSDAVRLTLDQVRLDRVPAHRSPERVRISLHGDAAMDTNPKPGLRVMTTAHLSPPAGPVEPGGFDFQRHAWFARLGAVGYTRVPLLVAEPVQEAHAELMVFRIRMTISAHIQTILCGDVGGFAAAITTGDRSGISQNALDDLRASNLAHLLAISGLHMGLLSAVVLAALRLILASHPFTALHWPTKGIAAIGALIAATGYLALSGGNVATERAYIMVTVALAALLIGRRAISLRAVAVAATIVLVLRPESLLGPGFQMSFAATTALVAVFGWLRDLEVAHIPRWLRPVLATIISSAVAGIATAPVAAAHFNAIAHYGLIANLLSVPLMGLLVIPAAVLAAVVAPFGLEVIPLQVMGWGLHWILGVADTVAAVDGARGYVPGPGGWVLPLICLGFLVLVLWQGRLRLLGVPTMALAFLLWQGVGRPEVLIADQGTLVGVMTANGRALSREKSTGFVARNWLENDGDGVRQEEAAARWADGRVIHLSGKRAVAAFDGCTAGQVVVTSVVVPPNKAAACLTFDPQTLKETGSVALSSDADGWRMVTARDLAGERLWTHWPGQKRPLTLAQYVRINPTSRP
ncbi:ComEC/Rec2 family competence protein [Sulfitobacter aestuariivivens]|uniref:ComEC/Rec2 family competence protein n=1 Tax=Sulfitobacter aestuariivivens TaxID=2766981 RepID=A0A927D628_9RHOB|nr:ComEC/Rec2 family competence protein [Sulfitobacter aestuariivivens]MBD3663481.1 ComEC/Rec2 family competence protein [Sulfitobacter aestuariivivens]